MLFQNSDVSKVISGMWKAETAEVRASYKDLALEASIIHQQENPGYKYRPRKPTPKQTIG